MFLFLVIGLSHFLGICVVLVLVLALVLILVRAIDVCVIFTVVVY